MKFNFDTSKFTIAEIRHKTGAKDSTVRMALLKQKLPYKKVHKKFLTPNQKALIYMFADPNKRPCELAKELNADRVLVHLYLRNHDLPFKGKKEKIYFEW